MQFIQMFSAFILTILLVIPTSSVPSSAVNSQYAGLAIDALQRLLNFFQRDSRDINVDGLFSLRIAQGQLISLQQTIGSLSNDEENRLTDQTHILESLSQQIDRIANESWKEIIRQNPSYFENFQLLLSKPFTFETHSKTLDLNLVETNTEKDSFFDVELSDRCFSELIHSTECSISDICWTKMRSNLTTDYRLTHQLLWILIAENMNCMKTDSLIQTENYFCANIYADATNNLANKTNEDLFLEQLLLCAIDGFDEFLRIDWLTIVLKWQHPLYDCFTGKFETSQRRRRHLLVERAMSDGCLSHKSGLAAGLFATYAKFFLLNIKK